MSLNTNLLSVKQQTYEHNRAPPVLAPRLQRFSPTEGVEKSGEDIVIGVYIKPDDCFSLLLPSLLHPHPRRLILGKKDRDLGKRGRQTREGAIDKMGTGRSDEKYLQ